MRAVSFCKTSASTVTRSTSTLTTSSGRAGILPAFSSLADWVDALFEFTRRSRVCEVTELSDWKRRKGTISETIASRNSTVGFRCFIVHLPSKSLRRVETRKGLGRDFRKGRDFRWRNLLTTGLRLLSSVSCPLLFFERRELR